MNNLNGILADANSMFRDGRFADALREYNKFLDANPEMRRLLSFNVDLCKKRLDEMGNQPFIREIGGEKNKRIYELLGKRISLPTKQALPDAIHIHKLFSSLDGIAITSDVVVSALICAQSSFFQRDLLRYVANLLRGFDSRFACVGHEVSGDGELNLGNILAIASDKIIWLKYRYLFRDWLLRENVNDNRAWEIFYNSPAEGGGGDNIFPKFGFNGSCPYIWSKDFCQSSFADDKSDSVAFATIFLNENKFIGLNLIQHYDICDEWVLVEGSCQGYPTRKVTSDGLSLDNGGKKVRIFPDPLGKIKYIQHGWTSNGGEDAKSELRNRYLEKISAKLIFVLDADEFYKSEDLLVAIKEFNDSKLFGLTLPQVHFWKSTENFVTGEYYDISHTRMYRNIPGMRYVRNHNFPEIGGRFVHELGHRKFSRTVFEISKEKFSYKEPCCFHMGFAKDYDDMKDKTDYYINRGEMETRKSTTASRAAWFDGDLPEKCRVRRWGGDLPDVLKMQVRGV